MFTIFGRAHRHCDGLQRREFLMAGALAFGGLTFADLLRLEAAAKIKSSEKAVINIHLDGGPPQMDMIDLKPDAPVEIRGEFKPIATKVVGLQICELMPKIAGIAEKFAFLRSLRWEKGRLIYYPDGWWVRMTPAIEVVPSDAQWQAFWSALDRVRVWSWQGDYSAGVRCGTPWELVIEHSGRIVRCSGNTGRAGATPARFREFIGALIELLGLPDTKLSWWFAE